MSGILMITALAMMAPTAPSPPSCLYPVPVTRTNECLPEQLFVYSDHNRTVAGSPYQVEVVVEALTRSGNIPAEGVPVTILFKRNNRVTKRTVPVRSGLATARFSVGTRAGTAQIQARYNEIFSNIRYVEIEPDKPRRFTFEHTPTAGTRIYTIKADNLTDKYNNQIRDGQIATIAVLDGGQLVSQKTTRIINGILRTEITVPHDRTTISATIGEMQVSVPVAKRRRTR